MRLFRASCHVTGVIASSVALVALVVPSAAVPGITGFLSICVAILIALAVSCPVARLLVLITGCLVTSVIAICVALIILVVPFATVARVTGFLAIRIAIAIALPITFLIAWLCQGLAS